MSSSTATPMLRQYHEIKSKHRDCILFFRLGDFYEMFGEDARTAAGLLDLVLTARGKGTPNEMPMCGVPYHSADGYIAKLIKAGLKVAICEQVEDPASAQGIVKRDVIRVISSGTFLDDSSSDSRTLLCLTPPAKPGRPFGLAFIDPTSGTISANQYAGPERIVEIMSRLPVCECVYPIDHADQIKALLARPLLRIKNIVHSPHDEWCFNPDIAKKNLCEHFGVPNLRGFGIEDLPGAVASAGALLEYLRQMNKQPLEHIDKLSLYADSEFAVISPAATFGLELETLFRHINRTLCALGKRRLHSWLYHPLKNPAAILQRQAAVTLLKDESAVQQKLKDLLKGLPDVEKCISRLSCGYLLPRDILAVRQAVALIPSLTDALGTLPARNRLFQIDDLPELRATLEAAVNPDMPLAKPEGKIVRPGYHAELDDLRGIQDNGRQWLKDFQTREARRTGINSLKVGFNKVFGYYIEITKANIRNAPADYIRKQTLVNAERFITQELKEYEDKILTAQDKINRIEMQILDELRRAVLNRSAELHQFCTTIARIDALYALALMAQAPRHIAPEITDDIVLDIKDGRHPVVESSVADFVPNDILLDGQNQHLIILTGPNMAGKSTYIRQIAVLTILAQMGSYIPATKARIGVVDKIFTRIGAHDDITKGQSTFMVEMNEMADILNNLTERSLIVLDEVGRGTSTYDGLSLAWSLAEYLKDIKARTLFATHFHEITALAEEHSGVVNFNVAVKEWKDEIVFLHKIVPGSTDDSYGIYVARLAGIPPKIIKRAKSVLTTLELKTDLKTHLTGRAAEDQMSFFGGASADEPSEPDELREELNDLDINQLTPMQALQKIQEWKEKIKKKD